MQIENKENAPLGGRGLSAYVLDTAGSDIVVKINLKVMIGLICFS
jgi:hypothetical protein